MVYLPKEKILVEAGRFLMAGRDSGRTSLSREQR